MGDTIETRCDRRVVDQLGIAVGASHIRAFAELAGVLISGLRIVTKNSNASDNPLSSLEGGVGVS